MEMHENASLFILKYKEMILKRIEMNSIEKKIKILVKKINEKMENYSACGVALRERDEVGVPP